MTALPTVTSPAPTPASRIDRPTYERLARRARLLSWLSLAWMTVEGAVAITAGLVASSIALVGFGLDSAIEGFASLVIVWRFTGSRMFSPVAETRAQKLVAIQFFLLAPYVAVESLRALIGGERPDETWVGIALAASSVVLMPLLGIAKQRIADQIGSAATKGEGRQNMLCAYLAAALLLGPRRQHGRRCMVAGPGRRPPDRRRGGQGGLGGLAWRGVLRQFAARRSGLRRRLHR